MSELLLDIQVRCTRCHGQVSGRIHFNDALRVADTDGGMLFNTGWTCHNCLGEPWSSADLVVPA